MVSDAIQLPEGRRRVVLVVLGSALFAFNINTFVHTAGLFPGGFSGLTILIQSVCERFVGFVPPYTLVNLLLNAFPSTSASAISARSSRCFPACRFC